MKSTTLRSLFRLRQYQFECEQWKLNKKQVEAMKITESMERTAELLHQQSEAIVALKSLSEKSQAYRFIEEVKTSYELDSRRLKVAQHEIEAQMLVLLEQQKKKEMMQHLLDKAIEADHLEEERQERLVMDDLAKNRTGTLSWEIL